MFDEKKIIGSADVTKTESGLYIVKNGIFIPEAKPLILIENGGVLV